MAYDCNEEWNVYAAYVILLCSLTRSYYYIKVISQILSFHHKTSERLSYLDEIKKYWAAKN